MAVGARAYSSYNNLTCGMACRSRQEIEQESTSRQHEMVALRRTAACMPPATQSECVHSTNSLGVGSSSHVLPRAFTLDTLQLSRIAFNVSLALVSPAFLVSVYLKP